MFEEQASPNYRVREVKSRRTAETSWEIVDASTGSMVLGGLADRDEALRVIRGWERLSQKIEGGLAGHVLVH